MLCTSRPEGGAVTEAECKTKGQLVYNEKGAVIMKILVENSESMIKTTVSFLLHRCHSLFFFCFFFIGIKKHKSMHLFSYIYAGFFFFLLLLWKKGPHLSPVSTVLSNTPSPWLYIKNHQKSFKKKKKNPCARMHPRPLSTKLGINIFKVPPRFPCTAQVENPWTKQTKPHLDNILFTWVISFITTWVHCASYSGRACSSCCNSTVSHSYSSSAWRLFQNSRNKVTNKEREQHCADLPRWLMLQKSVLHNINYPQHFHMWSINLI